MPLSNEIGFSELVNEAAVISGRTSLSRKLHLAAYANATIRECSVQSFFHRDMVEDQITAVVGTAEGAFIWDKPRFHRRFRTVRYPGTGAYPPLLLPGKIQRGKLEFYYAGPTYFAFKGLGNGDLVDIAYYAYPSRLRYYDDTPSNPRPAIYNFETDTWTYWDGATYIPDLGTPELNQAAEDLVANWLTQEWYDTILEGTLAKQWSKLGDQRSGSSFALYGALKGDIKKAELDESLDRSQGR